MTNITKVAVVGAGIMGHGIAEVAAISGQKVNLTDVKQEFLDRAREQIDLSLFKLRDRGTISDRPEEVIGRISYMTDLHQAVGDVDLVIEAVSEDVELKSRIFKDVDRLAPPHAILASNTSGLSINVLSQATKRPDCFIGMHWMNPPVLMPIIEIVRGDKTSDAVVDQILRVCKLYKKETVVAKRDVWYFLSARSQAGWHIGTAFMVHAGRASVQEVDAMARYKLGLPMGPFETADLTGAADIRVLGLASTKKILKNMPDFEPWPAFLSAFEQVVAVLWRPMRDKGLVGVKAGQGFYSYPVPGKYKRVDISKEVADKVDPVEALAAAVNTSAWCVTNRVGSVEAVDLCFKRAYGWPKGIFEFARDYGIRNIIRQLEDMRNVAPTSLKAFYQPDILLEKLSQL